MVELKEPLPPPCKGAPPSYSPEDTILATRDLEVNATIFCLSANLTRSLPPSLQRHARVGKLRGHGSPKNR